jgi:ubiquitin C-terminal hydrolase
MVQVDEHIRTEKPIGKPGSELGKNLILLTMLQNHENKTLEMVNNKTRIIKDEKKFSL